MNSTPTNFDQIYRAVFSGSPCAMLLADDHARFVDVNPAGEELLGSVRAELIGREIHEFVAPVRESRSRFLWEDFISHGRQAGKFIISRADGTDRKMSFLAVANVLPGLHLSVLFDEKEMPEIFPA